MILKEEAAVTLSEKEHSWKITICARALEDQEGSDMGFTFLNEGYSGHQT